jgi:hypothetical protein
MAIQMDQVKQTYYDAEVKKYYVTSGILNGKTREKVATPGSKVQFRKSGYGLAREHVPYADVVAMGASITPVECPIKAWDAFDYVDEFEPTTVNFDTISEIAQIAAGALGRRKDQIKIDAMAAGYDETNMKVGDGTGNCTLALLKDAKFKLDQNDVPFEDRIFIYDPVMLRTLLDDTQFTSSDFVEKRQLQEINAGTGKCALGFEFVMMSRKPEGGLPIASSKVTGFAYHKDAVGFASNKEISTSIDWIPEKRSWLVGGTFNGGAVVIDNRGVVGVCVSATVVSE